MSLTGFCVIGDNPHLTHSASDVQGRVEAYVWKHIPAGSTCAYTWNDPWAFVVLGSGVPPDPHSLKLVFGEHIAASLPVMSLSEAGAMWCRQVGLLSRLAYGDEGALRARVRP